MNKQLRIVGLVLILGLGLGFGYLQQPGWAAGLAGKGVANKLKHLFSPAANKAFSSALRPALTPATPMATITVTNLGDGAANAANCPGVNCRLRDAIAAAAAGDTINFSVTGTITLNSGELVINKNLTINGSGANLLTVSGNNASRVFGLSNAITVTIYGLTLSNGNSSTGGGIGFSTESPGTLNLNNCTVSNNTATILGGGIYVEKQWTVNINQSTFYNNSAPEGGGLVYDDAMVFITNSTFSHNQASTLGGAFRYYGFNSALTEVTLVNCTVSDNTAGTSGGGLFDQSATLRNTIVAGNIAPSGPDVSGSMTSLGHNLIGNNSGASFTAATGDQIGTAAAPINPLLAPLGNYGGPTQTRALLLGSLALNAGNNCVLTNNCASHNLGFNLTTDQRGAGFNRQVGSGVDIGAFESRGFTLAVAGGNNQSANINTAFANPLAVTVTATGAGEPVSGGQVTFTPPGSGASATIAGNPATISGNTATSGTVTANATGGAYNVTASALGATAAINFTLTNTVPNTAPTISDIANQTINEDNNTSALAFTVGDAQTPAASLSLSGASSNQALVPNVNIIFGGSGANRTVTVTPVANQSGTATITVTVTDAGGLTDNDTFLLTVNAVNDLPTISDVANQTINEDANTGALAFTVGDVETAAASLTVTGSSSNQTLLPNANISFGGSGANRTVTVTPAANQSGTATITITVTDANSGTASDTFLLTVNPINDLPTISDIANQTINEDATTGALSFTVGDGETPAGSLTLSGNSSNTTLVPNTNIVFGGAGASRTVTVTPAANQAGMATITITVTDANSGTASDSFVLTVTATNDPPTISNITNQTINEDATTGALVFTVGDVETPVVSLTLSGSSSNATLVPNANITFGGAGANRTVTVTPVANQSGTATITITVTDANSGTASDTFLLTVNAVNDNPTITDIANQTTNEDTATGAIAFTIGDVETAAASLTLSGSSANATLVPNANIVFGGAGANRTVTITPAANQTGTTTVTITVSDANGGMASDSFLLTVNGTNDPPTISNIANQATNEDTPTSAITFTVGDAETAAGSLTLAGSSSNTTLVPNANIVFGGAGANRTVTITPAANQAGTATITVTVSDGSGGSTPDSFVLTVNAVNDNPTISNITNQTINEDASTGALAFTVGDVETPAASLTVTGSSSNTALVPNANIVFGGSGANRTVTVTPAANQSGTATITVTVTDANSGTASDSFVLTVNAVNDPPTISDVTNQTINENASTSALPVTVGDVETAVGSLTLTGSSSNTTLLPNANIVFGGSGANRTVTITPAPNQFGTATITLTVTDGGGLTATDTFLLTVNNTNTAPTITAINQSRQQGNQPTNVQIATVLDAEDAENNLTVTVNGTTSATTNGVTISNLTGNAAGQVRADLALTCTALDSIFTLVVTDSRGVTASAILSVTVPANTAPAVGNYPNSTVVIGGTLTITPDVPPTDNNTVVSVTATAMPNSFTGSFSGNTSSGGVTVTNANPAGSYTITVSLIDNCGATTTRSFMLTVSACGAILSKQRELFAANGGTDSFTVTIDPVCSWTATSDNSDWITINAPVAGFAGPGTVSYSVATNTTSTRRTGSVTVAGQTFRVWQSARFNDVPLGHPFYDFIGKLSALGITLGCGNGNYCPDANTTREQMAIFIERGLGVFNPPVPNQQTFQDVPPTSFSYPFVEDLVARGITAGCAAGPPRMYCPTAAVTREQMAIFILRGLGVFNPPAGPATPTFADVSNSGATDYSYEFIEEFVRRGITSGCAAGPPRLYCPTGLVTRGQMAVFLVRAFGT
jgi:hypothetical protein